jgi:hypothetical protein
MTATRFDPPSPWTPPLRETLSGSTTNFRRRPDRRHLQPKKASPPANSGGVTFSPAATTTAGSTMGKPPTTTPPSPRSKSDCRQDEKEVLWVWAAQNKHDVSGYYWLISQLKDFQGRVFILYLNNLPFINEKGQLFYPNNLFEIPPREFLKARKLARAVTLSEFEIDPDEWQKLCQEDKGVRILEGGKKLTQYPYDYYDEELRRFISGDWIKASKLIGQFLGKAKQVDGRRLPALADQTAGSCGRARRPGRTERNERF